MTQLLQSFALIVSIVLLAIATADVVVRCEGRWRR
jgi:hypothetical protein